MNPDEIISLKFRNGTLTWRKDTLAQIPYFATLFKSEWSKDRTEFIMEEDPIVFVNMVKKYKKNARLRDMESMADYYGINPDDLISLKDDKHLLLDGYKEFSVCVTTTPDTFSQVNLSNAGKILSIKQHSGYNNIVIIKLDIDSDEIIRIGEKEFSSYILKEINKTKKFWVTITRFKEEGKSYDSSLFIDVKSCN